VAEGRLPELRFRLLLWDYKRAAVPPQERLQKMKAKPKPVRAARPSAAWMGERVLYLFAQRRGHAGAVWVGGEIVRHSKWPEWEMARFSPRHSDPQGELRGAKKYLPL
jgi:hypothetical protein